MDNPNPNGNADDPFANIVDDSDARKAAADWAYQQLSAGWSPESVVPHLVAQGWSESDAEEMAETARKQTRHLRGVVTRDDVASVARQPTRFTSAFNHGYIGEPDAFIDAGPPSPGQPGTTLNYHVPDSMTDRRIRKAKFRALLSILGGSALTLLGFFVFPFLAIGGVAIVIGGITAYRSPARLAGRHARSLLDRQGQDDA